jgi:catechol 2,3-dioxygenase-like lactoylglutathione lyase family enzyme
MKIEHLAINVVDPLSTSRWYIENLGFTVKRRVMEEPWTHFLADDSGTVMLEIYGNKAHPVLDYASLDVMSLHLALVTNDAESDVKRLETAGAKLEGQIKHLPTGDVMCFLRDPWGFTLQLVQRATPMI